MDNLLQNKQKTTKEDEDEDGRWPARRVQFSPTFQIRTIMPGLDGQIVNDNFMSLLESLDEEDDVDGDMAKEGQGKQG